MIFTIIWFLLGILGVAVCLYTDWASSEDTTILHLLLYFCFIFAGPIVWVFVAIHYYPKINFDWIKKWFDKVVIPARDSK